MILPQIDQGPLYNQFNFCLPLEVSGNSPAISSRLPVFLCPSDLYSSGTFNITSDAANTVVVVKASPSCYPGCVGNDSSDVGDNSNPGNGILYRNSRVRFADVTDGTTNTIVVGERSWAQTNGTWIGTPNNGLIRAGQKNPYAPLMSPASFAILAHTHWINILTDPDGGMDDYSSLHTGGAHFLFCDGSVRFLSTVTSAGGIENDYQAMGSRNGGEVQGGFGN